MADRSPRTTRSPYRTVVLAAVAVPGHWFGTSDAGAAESCRETYTHAGVLRVLDLLPGPDARLCGVLSSYMIGPLVVGVSAALAAIFSAAAIPKRRESPGEAVRTYGVRRRQ